MNFRKERVVGNTDEFAKSVVDTSKDRKDCTHRKDVVEVCDNVISRYNSSHDKDRTRSSSC